MKTNKVIKRKYLPTKFPVTFTAVLWLYLDKYNAPSWLIGVVATICVLLWIRVAIDLSKEKEVRPKFTDDENL